MLLYSIIGYMATRSKNMATRSKNLIGIRQCDICAEDIQKFIQGGCKRAHFRCNQTNQYFIHACSPCLEIWGKRVEPFRGLNRPCLCDGLSKIKVQHLKLPNCACCEKKTGEEPCQFAFNMAYLHSGNYPPLCQQCLYPEDHDPTNSPNLTHKTPCACADGRNTCPNPFLWWKMHILVGRKRCDDCNTDIVCDKKKERDKLIHFDRQANMEELKRISGQIQATAPELKPKPEPEPKIPDTEKTWAKIAAVIQVPVGPTQVPGSGPEPPKNSWIYFTGKALLEFQADPKSLEWILASIFTKKLKLQILDTKLDNLIQITVAAVTKLEQDSFEQFVDLITQQGKELVIVSER